jgi:DNA helicase HerA-like ATPase
VALDSRGSEEDRVDYEKLGAFYLGRRYDPEENETTQELVLYDSKDLTTHAVIVGMTGSGKTGLGVAILEEAAIDGIPVIAIDPKGDLGNLLLTFPRLEPGDFRPWIDESDATRKGRTPDEHARKTAEMWRQGLADWGQPPERIARLAGAAERTIYTPGSRAGRPLAVLRSFAAPPAAVLEDEEALRDRIGSAAASLLGLVGIDADPIRSREQILLATLLERAWRAGRDLDLPTLIHQIQSPPVERVGVFELESFYPSKDRFELAMALNNLLASPGFAVWTEGEPLDIPSLLHGPDGSPRTSVLSIAHLDDAQRMFFVTLLLSELVAWMRTQPGTGGLRALLYMDEVFGYLPPTANPPSKIPLLTLLKQARAFGVGCVLATQNPVDLDYKALSNAGTWFLGRLQTERDKARVIEGLEGASTAAQSFDRAAIERTLAGLDSRVFLMNNVHEDAPTLFHTRWVMSYLAGPLARDQIRRLTPAQEVSAVAPAPTAAPDPRVARAERPVLPAGLREVFLPATRRRSAGERIVYRPMVGARATLHYANARANIDDWTRVALLAPLDDASVSWEEARDIGSALPEFDPEPEAGASFAKLPAGLGKAHKGWEKSLETCLYRERPLQLWRCRKPKAIAQAGETEGDFRARVRELLRDARDLAVEKLRKRYAPKLARLQDQIDRAEQTVEVQREQYKSKKLQTVISIGATVVGALFGRKLGSGTVGRASTAARRASTAARERGDVGRAQERVEALQERLEELEQQFANDLEELQEPIALDEIEISELRVAPRKSDLAVEELVLVWAPWRVDESGIAESAFED